MSAAAVLRRVAVLQVTCTPDKAANLLQCARLVREAASAGARFICLPECFDYVERTRERTMGAAEHPRSSSTLAAYRALARETGAWLSLGGMHLRALHDHEHEHDHERGDAHVDADADAVDAARVIDAASPAGAPRSDTRIRNMHIVLDDAGRVRAAYQKVHLFDVTLDNATRAAESEYTQPGERFVVVRDTPIGCVGLATCYDVRFAEQFSALRAMGADVILVPSAFFPQTGAAHWEVLMRCRAIDAQCYIVAAAQAGRNHEKRACYGHAMVVDPWGAVLRDLGDESPAFATADIDDELIGAVRGRLPVALHRRPALYASAAPASSSSAS